MLYAAAVFIVPEALALLLFIIPWVRNFVENSQWRIFHLLTWWFQVNYGILEIQSLRLATSLWFLGDLP